MNLRPLLVLGAIAAIGSLSACDALLGAAAKVPAGVTGSALPGAVATAVPGAVATIGPGSPQAALPTAKPAAPGTGSELQGPEACSRTIGDHDTGVPGQGKFNGQGLPKTWATALRTEADVLNAIDKLYIDDWPCFQKFYPGAAGLYIKARGL